MYINCEKLYNVFVLWVNMVNILIINETMKIKGARYD